MSKFCGTCGSPLSEGKKFCAKCGAASPIPSQPSPAQAQSTYTPVVQPQPTVIPGASPARSNTMLKVGIAAVAIVVVGGIAAAGAVYYGVHKVKEKVQEVKNQVEGGSPSSASAPAPGGLASLVQNATASAPSNGDDSASFKGDPCRFLSKEDVSRAVGIEIVRAEGQGPGCSYIAKGDPADMVSKHMTSMVTSQAKSKGSTPTTQQQKMMQQITGAFFKQQETSDKDLSKEAQTGEVPILSVSFSSGNAEMEMKMNRAGFNHLKGGANGETTDQTASGDLDGIGDEAYEMGGSALIFRKGQNVVHMMFIECPCDANAIKPLAATVASKL